MEQFKDNNVSLDGSLITLITLSHKDVFFPKLKPKRVVLVLRHNEWTIRVSSYLDSNPLKSYNVRFKKKILQNILSAAFFNKIINQPFIVIFHHKKLEIKVKLQISYKELRFWVSSKHLKTENNEGGTLDHCCF